MPQPTIATWPAFRGGTGTRLVLPRSVDPMFRNLRAWNQRLVLERSRPAGTVEPLEDGRDYAFEGGQRYCRPYLEIAQGGAMFRGPRLRFDRRDDGVYLVATFEEAVDQRVGGAVPFPVRVQSVELAYRDGQVLTFSEPLQQPLDDPAGPAFRVEVEAKVPPARVEQLRQDLEGKGQRAFWRATLELGWTHLVEYPATFNLAALSPSARWEGAQLTDASGNARDGAALPWMGDPGDSRGFARYDSVQLEDGRTLPALRTHPKWVEQGTIKGWHQGFRLPPHAAFEAEVGFVAGAVHTDGVTFVVFEHHLEGDQPRWNPIVQLHKGYSGQLERIRADLSHLAGQQVGIELRVDAGPSSGQDWAAWVEPRVIVSPPPPAPAEPPAEPEVAATMAAMPIEGRGDGGLRGRGTGFRPPPGWPPPVQPPVVEPSPPVAPTPGDPPPPLTSGAAVVGHPRTVTVERRWPADFPDTGVNKHIYAALEGTGTLHDWQSSAAGWFQPSPVQDTVNCLPTTYRLAVDEATGLPAVQMFLLPKDGAGPADPARYQIRLALRVVPWFDPNKLEQLRALVRGMSDGTVKYADLVLGGYRAARYVPDETLAGLGELLAGLTVGGGEAIDPANGFFVTYLGDAETIGVVLRMLQDERGEGIGGSVELDLANPAGSQKQRVPAQLSFRRLAPVPLRWEPVPPPPAPAVGEGPPLPELLVTNPARRPVKLTGIRAFGLERSPISGRVGGWQKATPEGVEGPLMLAPAQAGRVRLRLDDPAAPVNAWDISVAAAEPELDRQLVLNELFDLATGDAPPWRVEVTCIPLEEFDQLPPDEQAAIAHVKVEVEVCRPDRPDTVQDVILTRDKFSGHVDLHRTVADVLGGDAASRSAFEWRRRLHHPTGPGDWSDWDSDSGTTLSVYIRDTPNRS
jgi:hypothetical protein